MELTRDQINQIFECGRNFQVTGENNLQELLDIFNPPSIAQLIEIACRDFIKSMFEVPTKLYVNSESGNELIDNKAKCMGLSSIEADCGLHKYTSNVGVLKVIINNDLKYKEIKLL